MSKPAALTQADFQHAAARLGVPVAAIKAVYAVESSGAGFLQDGQIKVNYEPHLMYRRLRENLGLEEANAALNEWPDLVARKSGHIVPQAKEHAALDKAVLIDRTSAIESTSWGAPQILGLHWKRLGFADAQKFVNRMFQGEVGQLDVFVRFIETDPALHKAMKTLNWDKFAEIYNGPNYRAGNYHVKMANEFKKASA